MNRRKIYNNRIMLTVAMVMVFVLMILGSMKLVYADKGVEYEKSFLSFEVKEGDTLTSIAAEYAISEAEYSDYMEEVKSINNLKDDTIHAGCYLMIPIYQPIQSNLAMQN